MLRGVKDEANRMNQPLFPRVHVNDTEKGRSSISHPRNNIALYQQLKIPSQSHVSDSHSTLSLPPTTTSSSRSTCIADGRKKNLFIPLCNTTSPLKFSDKLKSSSQSISKSNVTVDSLERRLDYPSLGASSKSANKLDSFKQNDYNFKNSSFKNLNTHRFVAPVGQSEIDLYRRKDPQTSTDLSLQLHNSSSKATVLEEKPREYTRNGCENRATIHSQEFANPPSKFESLMRPSAPRNQETSCFSHNVLNNVPFRESPSMNFSGDAGAKSSSKVRTQSDRSLVGCNNRSPNKPEAVYQLEHVMGVDSHEDVSECSVMDSTSGWNASPNEVVKAIGHKQFWKIRTAMIYQQKIFAGQVFELHRLISVQRRLARSPNLLLESKCNLSKPGTLKESSHLREIVPKVKPNTERLKAEIESPEEHMIPKFPLPPISKELVTEQCSSTVTNTQSSSPWCFTTPGSQWLVPVVSPSEGLIYKPYTGQSLPTSGFMVPFYSNKIIEKAFRFPVSHSLGRDHFPPDATPVVEHAIPFAHTQNWSSLSRHASQAVPFSLRNSRASKDSDILGSTASSPPKRHKPDVLPLFPTEPTQLNAETHEHKQQSPPRAIKTTPHNAVTASESAARIFRVIQEERGHTDHMIR